MSYFTFAPYRFPVRDMTFFVLMFTKQGNFKPEILQWNYINVLQQRVSSIALAIMYLQKSKSQLIHKTVGEIQNKCVNFQIYALNMSHPFRISLLCGSVAGVKSIR